MILWSSVTAHFLPGLYEAWWPWPLTLSMVYCFTARCSIVGGARIGALKMRERKYETGKRGTILQGMMMMMMKGGKRRTATLLMCNYSDFFWTVLLISRTMDVAFCLCTVIFVFCMDHANLVFRRCMCTCRQCEVLDMSNTSHCWRIYFYPKTLSWHRINYDVHTCSMTGY